MSWETSKTNPIPIDREYFLSLFSGIESGLATTTAIIAGLALGTQDQSAVFVGAAVGMVVQAFNSANSRFNGERTNDEIEEQDLIIGYKKPLIDAGAQFVAHAFVSLLILLPIVLMDDLSRAVISTIVITLVLMSFFGFLRGLFIKRSAIRNGLELLVTGALVISAGIAAGLVLHG